MWLVTVVLAHNLQHPQRTMGVLHVAGEPWSILWSLQPKHTNPVNGMEQVD